MPVKTIPLEDIPFEALPPELQEQRRTQAAEQSKKRQRTEQEDTSRRLSIAASGLARGATGLIDLPANLYALARQRIQLIGPEGLQAGGDLDAQPPWNVTQAAEPYLAQPETSAERVTSGALEYGIGGLGRGVAALAGKQIAKGTSKSLGGLARESAMGAGFSAIGEGAGAEAETGAAIGSQVLGLATKALAKKGVRGPYNAQQLKAQIEEFEQAGIDANLLTVAPESGAIPLATIGAQGRTGKEFTRVGADLERAVGELEEAQGLAPLGMLRRQSDAPTSLEAVTPLKQAVRGRQIEVGNAYANAQDAIKQQVLADAGKLSGGATVRDILVPIRSVNAKITERINEVPLANALVASTAKKLGLETKLQTGKMTLDEFDMLRRFFGSKTNFDANTVSDGLRKAVYGILDDTYGATIKSISPRGYTMWRQAQTDYAKFKDVEGEVLQPFLDKPEADQALDNLIAGAQKGRASAQAGLADAGTLDLMRFRREVGEKAWTKALPTMIARMGRTKEAALDTMGNLETSFDLQKFANTWASLSPAAKNALVGGAGTLQRDYDVLSKAILNFGQAGERAGRLQGVGKMVSKGYGVAGSVSMASIPYLNAGAGILASFLVGGTAVGSNRLANALGNPKFVKWAAEASTSPSRDIPLFITRLSKLAADDASLRPLAEQAEEVLQGPFRGEGMAQMFLWPSPEFTTSGRADPTRENMKFYTTEIEEDKRRDRTAFNLNELEKEIRRAKNPRTKATLQAEYARIREEMANEQRK